MNVIKNHGLRLASQGAGMSAVLSSMEAVARSAGSTKSEPVRPDQNGSKQFELRGSRTRDGIPAAGTPAKTARARRPYQSRTRAKVFLRELLWWWSVYPS